MCDNADILELPAYLTHEQYTIALAHQKWGIGLRHVLVPMPHSLYQKYKVDEVIRRITRHFMSEAELRQLMARALAGKAAYLMPGDVVRIFQLDYDVVRRTTLPYFVLGARGSARYSAQAVMNVLEPLAQQEEMTSIELCHQLLTKKRKLGGTYHLAKALGVNRYSIHRRRQTGSITSIWLPSAEGSKRREHRYLLPKDT